MQHSDPTFSVVIPNHGRVQPVVDAVRSALRDAPPTLDVIVVDDASPNRAEIDAALRAIADPRVRTIWLTTKGTAARARNAGVDAARGDWIAFLDSDDAFEPGKWQALARAIRADGSADVFYDQASVAIDGRQTHIVPERAMHADERVGDFLFVHDQLLSTCTLTVRRSVLQRVPWRAGLPRHQDLQLVLDLERSGARFAHVAAVGTTIHWSTATRPASKGESATYSLNWLDTVHTQLGAMAFRRAAFRFGVIKLLEAGHRVEAVRVVLRVRAVTGVRPLLTLLALLAAPPALRRLGYRAYKRWRPGRATPRPIATPAVAPAHAA